MTIQSAITAIKARLDDAAWPWPVQVTDGPPDGTPSGPYICIYDQTGMPLRRKYQGGVSGLYLPFQLSCVARQHDALRELIRIARLQVCDWRPVGGSSPIVESGSNPVLSTGVGNDQRLTAPLTLHCYLPPEA